MNRTTDLSMESGRNSFIDTHTHIYYADDEQELDAQMTRCANQGVDQLLLPNVDRASVAKLQHAAERYPGRCLPMMGLHPGSVKEDYVKALGMIEQSIANWDGDRFGKLYGIGEIGLDLYWDQTHLAAQKEAFRIQTTWAKSLGLPVSIHCRDAYDELFQLLEEVQDGQLRGVLHCFTGTLEQARQTTAYGLSLGIGGVVTFKNAGLDRVVAQLDPAHLVLETDAPYLAPVPYRGKQNESSYLLYIAKKVADLQQMSLSEVAQVTSKNAKSIFGL